MKPFQPLLSAHLSPCLTSLSPLGAYAQSLFLSQSQSYCPESFNSHLQFKLSYSFLLVYGNYLIPPTLLCCHVSFSHVPTHRLYTVFVLTLLLAVCPQIFTWPASSGFLCLMIQTPFQHSAPSLSSFSCPGIFLFCFHFPVSTSFIHFLIHYHFFLLLVLAVSSSFFYLKHCPFPQIV